MIDHRQYVPVLNCCCTRVKTDAVADRRNRPSVSSPKNSIIYLLHRCSTICSHPQCFRLPSVLWHC